MAVSDTDDGLVVTQEGTCARAKRGRLNFLFRERSADTVRAEYRESAARVRSRFYPRLRLCADMISDAEFGGLTQEIALHWMYFYIINKLPVDVSDTDLGHPQTTDLIWSFLRRKYGDESPQVAVIASALTGMTRNQFDQWLVGWKRFLER